MQHFIAFSALLAVTSASTIAFYAATPQLRASPYLTYGTHSSSLITPTQQQYHSQDEFGQYAYGYREPLSAKQEVRTLDGTTRGSYSYYDSEGKLQTVDYTADADGFRVAATNLPRATPAAASELPIPVADTDAVAAARKAHLAAHQAAKSNLAETESDSVLVSAAANGAVETPAPVQDTVEVAAAKVEHLKRVEHEQQRNELLRKTGYFYGNTLPLMYRSAVYPSIYSYPLNSRFLAPSYIY